MSGAHILAACMALFIIFGMSWALRVCWKAGSEILQQQRADRDELERWRVAMVQYERWLAEFPVVALVLESLQAEAAGRQLSMSPRSEGPYTVDALRDRLRAFFQLDLSPIISRIVQGVVPPPGRQAAGSSEREEAMPNRAFVLGQILLSNGHFFDFFAPERCVYDVEVISAALSKMCRWTGQCSEFIPVSQHAVIMSYLVPDEDAFEALHHDDEEFVVNDMAKPFKELLPDYMRYVRRVRADIRKRLGLAETPPPSVKHFDQVMQATESRDFMPHGLVVTEWQDNGEGMAPTPLKWHIDKSIEPWYVTLGIKPLEKPLQAWTPAQAHRNFMARHYELLALREVHAQKARAA